MTDAKPTRTYERNDRGAWIPTDDPNSIAKEMTAHSRLYWFVAKSWAYSETSSFGRECDAVLPSNRGENSRARLRLVLNTERRRFHTIRAEGKELIGGSFKLDVYILANATDELGGFVRHWPARDDDQESDDLLGTVMVGEPLMRQLVEGLRQDKRVAIGLQMPVFKEAIAHSFDEHWMLQDLYVPYDENVQIDMFQVDVTEERGEHEGLLSAVDEELPSEPEPIALPMSSSPRSNVETRLNWILILLAIISAILLFR